MTIILPDIGILAIAVRKDGDRMDALALYRHCATYVVGRAVTTNSAWTIR